MFESSLVHTRKKEKNTNIIHLNISPIRGDGRCYVNPSSFNVTWQNISTNYLTLRNFAFKHRVYLYFEGDSLNK